MITLNRPGSISQIQNHCRADVTAKESNVPVILIGHITKDGNIAGPKILGTYDRYRFVIEGDRNHVYRILRSTKIVLTCLR
jgi:DNA repair protein RadA/Sms